MQRRGKRKEEMRGSRCGLSRFQVSFGLTLSESYQHPGRGRFETMKNARFFEKDQDQAKDLVRHPLFPSDVELDLAEVGLEDLGRKVDDEPTGKGTIPFSRLC